MDHFHVSISSDTFSTVAVCRIWSMNSFNALLMYWSEGFRTHHNWDDYRDVAKSNQLLQLCAA